eukprot:538830_1
MQSEGNDSAIIALLLFSFILSVCIGQKSKCQLKKADFSLLNIMALVVIGNWYRKAVTSYLYIEHNDIKKIITEYFGGFDSFHPLLCHKRSVLSNTCQKISNNGSLLALSAFGVVSAVSGKIYHWRFHLSKDCTNFTNIGVIEANKCDNKCDNTCWWHESFGYSYFSQTGEIWNNNLKYGSKSYGERYGRNDIIDVWLDLKDKYELLFGKNGKCFDKAFDMKRNTQYRFAVCFSVGEITLENSKFK